MGTLVFQATLGGAVNIIGPNIANTINFTLPSADGTSGQTWTTNGSGVLAFGTLGIAGGGTGQITATAAFNALAPSQSGQSGKYLTTDGTNTSWGTNPLGTVTSVAATVPSFLSIAGSPITTSGTLAFTLSGTALPTTSGGTGLTSFTSGGVVYASSSSALATGSGLVFDGTAFGVGITPSAWVAGYSVLQVGKASWYTDGNGFVQFANNTYQGSGYVDRYIGSSYANKYEQSDSHKWYTAPSGTAGNAVTFSEQMRLTSTGLGIGTSSPDARLDVTRSGNGQIAVLQTSANRGFSFESQSDTALQIASVQGSTNLDLWANTLSFSAGATERMRITSAGDVGIGTSSPDVKLSVVGDLKLTGSSPSYPVITMIDSTSGGSSWALISGIPALGDFSIRESGVANQLTFKKTSGNAVFAGNIGIGGTTPTTSGTGITFPATQSASSDANTLDDYEEGTWTPSVSVSGFTQSVSSTSGSYTKIGNVVTVRMAVNLSSSGRPTSYSEISGIPFTPSATSVGVFAGGNPGAGIQGGSMYASSGGSLFWYATNGTTDSNSWFCTVTYFV
jgi:hypothetical protein